MNIQDNPLRQWGQGHHKMKTGGEEVKDGAGRVCDGFQEELSSLGDLAQGDLGGAWDSFTSGVGDVWGGQADIWNGVCDWVSGRGQAQDNGQKLINHKR